MSEKEIIGKIENLLFAAGESMPVKGIAELLGEDEMRVNEVLEAEIARREKEYGLVIRRFGDGVQLATRADCAKLLFTAFGRQGEEELTRAMLETLAIIAYKQPITRAEIEEIRGVNASYMVAALLDRKLIKVVGQKDSIGRPKMYGTDEEFLRHFGIHSLKDLPPLPEQEENEKAEFEY